MARSGDAGAFFAYFMRDGALSRSVHRKTGDFGKPGGDKAPPLQSRSRKTGTANNKMRVWMLPGGPPCAFADGVLEYRYHTTPSAEKERL